MTTSFRKPALWTRVFEQTNQVDREEAARLEAAWTIFRERTATLLQKIATSLPGLTVHDITHIDALWETADLIVGPNYPLNPMEVFVLGGAMLMHDAALCFEAYEGGLEGVRQTIQWRDAYAAEQDRNKERDIPLGDFELEAAADFSAVRLLHGDQAPALIERSWIDPDTSQNIFLIDDSEIRKRFSSIIGQIAASHSWSMEDVSSKLPNQINAPGDWPPAWRIDPIKLACILRCADAAHIDNRRAPDFLHALTRRGGISLKHWKAQNWLARADLDQSDRSRSTIVFTSTREFRTEDADAWWIAFDAIRLVDKEIRESNALLASRPQESTSPQFAIRRVAGVSSPEAMALFLRTKGWKPWHAELHVGNVERLVKNLGGQSLYGGDKLEHFGIVVRELIQNARDAVIARRALDQDYVGKVRIRLNDGENGPATLEVTDDGIGMSERVLIGPLLDFGSSFWKSDLVNEEFPGLRSSGFGSVGRYGIGFYSTFMVAESVRVTSRRWDRGIDTAASISFPKGLSLRPIFSTNVSTAIVGSNSTIVSCTLKTLDESRPSVRVIKISNTDEFEVPFTDFVSRLTTGLDVPVEVRINNDDWVAVHEPIKDIVNSELAKANWLEKITLSKHISPDSPQLGLAAKRLRPIVVDGAIAGLAALSVEIGDANANRLGGVYTVGGFLPAGYAGTGGQGTFYGYMEQFSGSAKREPGKPVAPPSVINDWVNEQLRLLSERQLTIPELLGLTNNLSTLNCDPSPYLHAVFFKGQQALVLTLDQIVQVMKSEPVAFFKFRMMNHVDSYVQQPAYQHYLTFKPVTNSPFLSLELEGAVPKNPNSLIGCLHRSATKDGFKLRLETLPTTIPSIGGPAEIVLATLEAPKQP